MLPGITTDLAGISPLYSTGSFPETSIIFVEDVITTGGSVLKASNIATSEGLSISGILSLVDREEGAREEIERAGYKIISIFRVSELL